MDEVMQRLMVFECASDEDPDEKGWEEMNERLAKAIESYQAAFARFRYL